MGASEIIHALDITLIAGSVAFIVVLAFVAGLPIESASPRPQKKPTGLNRWAKSLEATREIFVMITIDDILDKYRGFTGATPEQVEGVHKDLSKQPRAEQIGYYLGLFGSYERSIPLYEATIDESPEVFWSVVLENWCDCDGLWPLRRILLDTLRRRRAQRSPIEFQNTSDRRFYDELPDVVTVYRGCGRRRIRGLPWTTNRAVANYFAGGGRFTAPPDPVIASAVIAKADIFFVSAERAESEVILDPYSIKRLRLESASDA